MAQKRDYGLQLDRSAQGNIKMAAGREKRVMEEE